ncbi:MAG: FG-GAP repeat domain-containing protein [Planctomycetota bacterium]
MTRRTVLCLLWAAAVGGAQETWKLKRLKELAPRFAVSQYRVVDVDGDGRDEVLLIGVGGEVRVWSVDPRTGALPPRPRGTLVLAEPAHALLALADLLRQGGPPQLLVLDPRGATLHPVGGDGTFAPDPVPLARRARFRLRTGRPFFADIVRDINGDDRPDLIVPSQEFFEVWINEADAGGAPPRLRRAARVAVDLSRSESMAAQSLSDRLWSTFSVPRLHTRDVNGDGRRDLLVESGNLRAFHLQRPDSTLSPEPDVTVDLGIFRDTTPAATIRPGRILAGGDSQRYQTRDLDGDGIPDYVIAHRRKVWVFHGNRIQPQFTEPTTILKVSDDVTALLLIRLDEDEYPDLLILKVHVPTIGTLIVGTMREFDVEIDALGYASQDGKGFTRTPRWRSRITVRVPALFKILKNPAALLARFEEVGRKFRPVHEADLDGDGATETIMASEDRTRLDLWRGDPRGPGKRYTDYEAVIRRVLFEEEEKSWDIDRILRFVAGLAEQRAARLTGGRDPDLSYPLRDAARYRYRGLALGDLNGDQRAEIVVRYTRLTRTGTVFDIVGR